MERIAMVIDSMRITFVFTFMLAWQAGWSQQNFFNVPSSDITVQQGMFVQEQFNIDRHVIQSNTTFCYGLGHQFEIGFNVLGLYIDTDFSKPYLYFNNGKYNAPSSPGYTFNAQKAVVLSKIFKVALGTQIGMSPAEHFVNYSYLNLVAALTKSKSKLVAGLYYGNESMIGYGSRNIVAPGVPLGMQTGLEQTIIPDRLYFIVENITGHHAMGETTLGGSLFITSNLVLSGGFELANPHAEATNATVVELTYVPSAHVQKRIHHHGHSKATS